MEGLSRTGCTDPKYMSALKELWGIHEEFLRRIESRPHEGLIDSVKSIKTIQDFETHLAFTAKFAIETHEKELFALITNKYADVCSYPAIVAEYVSRVGDMPKQDELEKGNDFLRSFSINQSTGTVTLVPIDIYNKEIAVFGNFLINHVSSIKSDASEVKYERTHKRDSYREFFVHTVHAESDVKYEEFQKGIQADLKKYDFEIKALDAFLTMIYTGRISSKLLEENKDKTFFLELLKLYNTAVKSRSFISLKNNSIISYSELMKTIKIKMTKHFADLSKSRVAIGLVRLITYFFNHIYDSRKCRSYMAYGTLSKQFKILDAFEGDFENLMKKRWIKFNSLSKYTRCLTQKELDLWGQTVSLQSENECFSQIKSCYANQDIMFVIILKEFSSSNNKKLRFETWEKFLSSRNSDFSVIVDAEKNKSLRGRSVVQGKPSISEVSLEVLETYKKGLLDPLSRNLALKGIYFNSRNPYFGDSLITTIGGPSSKLSLTYSVGEAHFDSWRDYVHANYKSESSLVKATKEEFFSICEKIVRSSQDELKVLYK
jgi:hypothetical protein